MKSILIITLILANHFAFAQNESKTVTSDTKTALDTTNSQEEAEYPGGMVALMKFITTSLLYPIECADKNIQGKVYVEFVIDELGKVGNVKIKRGIHPLLDAEAMRIVLLFPEWKPAINNGKNVKQRFTLPINFIIHDDPTLEKNKKRKKR